MQAYSAAWYHQSNTSLVSQPSGEGSGPEALQPQYNMGVTPVLPSAPPQLSYSIPSSSQDIHYEGVAPGSTSTPGMIPSSSQPPPHQRFNLVIDEEETTGVASSRRKLVEHDVAVMTWQQRANNPPLESIFVEESVSEEAPNIPAVNQFYWGQLIGNPLESPLGEPSMEENHLDPLNVEEDNLYQFVDPTSLEN